MSIQVVLVTRSILIEFHQIYQGDSHVIVARQHLAKLLTFLVSYLCATECLIESLIYKLQWREITRTQFELSPMFWVIVGKRVNQEGKGDFAHDASVIGSLGQLLSDVAALRKADTVQLMQIDIQRELVTHL